MPRTDQKRYLVVDTEEAIYDIRFNHFQIEITGRCNMRCQHCRGADQTRKDMPVDQIVKIIRFARQFSTAENEVIISGGENIYPAELENVLAACPKIAECAVVGVADAKWGEAACACVVASEQMNEAEVLKLFEDRLAKFKHPRRVVFLDSLPRNAMGKVLKPELKLLVS